MKEFIYDMQKMYGLFVSRIKKRRVSALKKRMPEGPSFKMNFPFLGYLQSRISAPAFLPVRFEKGFWYCGCPEFWSRCKRRFLTLPSRNICSMLLQLNGV